MWGQNDTSDLSSIELGHNIMGLGAGSASEPRTCMCHATKTLGLYHSHEKARSRDLYTDFANLLQPQEATLEQACNQYSYQGSSIDPRMANPALFVAQFVDLRRR